MPITQEKAVAPVLPITWAGAIPIHSANLVFQPEDSPFTTLHVDVTHRCNMRCENCFVPNRSIPDMDMDWLRGILERLPRRARIRLVGAEPTVRRDLPEIIAMVRETGRHPILLTNGLKLADRAYVGSLKDAGLTTCYLSFNGGLDDEAYRVIDGAACAAAKLQALDNLVDEQLYVALGMILVRGVNERHVRPVFERIRGVRRVAELKLRSIGRFGRYIEDSAPLTMAEMRALAREVFGPYEPLPDEEPGSCHEQFRVGRLLVQMTEWPELGSLSRGRLSPDGTVQPHFEHVLANEGGY